MPQEVAFDPCQLTHANLRDCAAASDLAIIIALSPLILLLFAPRVLGSIFERLGWSRAEAVRFCIPPAYETLYLATVAVMTFVATLWTLSPDGIPGAGLALLVLEATTFGDRALLGLSGAALLGGPLLLGSLLQFSVEKRVGPSFASLLMGAATLGVIISLAAANSLRVDVLLLATVLGTGAVIVMRQRPRVAAWTAATLLAATIVWTSLYVTGRVVMTAYESLLVL